MEQTVTQFDGPSAVAIVAVVSAAIVAIVGIVLGVWVRAKASKNGLDVETGGDRSTEK
ncbi:MAG: hypothetical protein GY842_01725 [bacterium]|nr:hypothetical protein [bacterium]